MTRGPTPATATPRADLLAAAAVFVRAARSLDGVLRIAFVGSILTPKPVPKDVDLLVTIADDIGLAPLARLGRQLQGRAQSFNLGADIFLCDRTPRYLGRICAHRVCHYRARCAALHCGARQHLNDDLGVLTLADDLLRQPPLVVWPYIETSVALPPDVAAMVAHGGALAFA